MLIDDRTSLTVNNTVNSIFVNVYLNEAGMAIVEPGFQKRVLCTSGPLYVYSQETTALVLYGILLTDQKHAHSLTHGTHTA